MADFLQLLQQSKQSSERQLGYMKEATSVIHTYLKGSPEKGEGRREIPCEVPLPAINDKTVCVLVNDFRLSQQATLCPPSSPLIPSPLFNPNLV